MSRVLLGYHVVVVVVVRGRSQRGSRINRLLLFSLSPFSLLFFCVKLRKFLPHFHVSVAFRLLYCCRWFLTVALRCDAMRGVRASQENHIRGGEQRTLSGFIQRLFFFSFSLLLFSFLLFFTLENIVRYSGVNSPLF